MGVLPWRYSINLASNIWAVFEQLMHHHFGLEMPIVRAEEVVILARLLEYVDLRIGLCIYCTPDVW